MLMLASSNDSLFFLSRPEGTELLPTQGEHRGQKEVCRKASETEKEPKSRVGVVTPSENWRETA